MHFTKFSRTGLSVSCLCLGTGTFGKQTDEAESFRTFDKAADVGVNFIDAADVYPGGADLPEVGRAEERAVSGASILRAPSDKTSLEIPFYSSVLTSQPSI